MLALRFHKVKSLFFNFTLTKWKELINPFSLEFLLGMLTLHICIVTPLSTSCNIMHQTAFRLADLDLNKAVFQLLYFQVHTAGTQARCDIFQIKFNENSAVLCSEPITTCYLIVWKLGEQKLQPVWFHCHHWEQK